MVLFVSLTLFVIINFVELMVPSFNQYGYQPDTWYPKIEWATISALSVTMLAYSYQQNVFPIYSELRNKCNEEYCAVSKLALPMTGTIYLAVGLICCCMFGADLKSSVLLNIGEMRKPGGGAYWEAYVV